MNKIDSSEKILCFIASGKWIVTQSYLKDSFKEKRFLEEKDYHIFNKFPHSKFAFVSMKYVSKNRQLKIINLIIYLIERWKTRIEENIKNYPFYGWKVACMIENISKANALIR